MPTKLKHKGAQYVPDCAENYKADLNDLRNLPIDLNQVIQLSRRNTRKKISRKKAA